MEWESWKWWILKRWIFKTGIFKTRNLSKREEYTGKKCMCRELVLYFKPIRSARFDSGSVNHGLPVVEPARGLDLCGWPKGSRPLGTRMPHPSTCNKHVPEVGEGVKWSTKKKKKKGQKKKSYLSTALDRRCLVTDCFHLMIIRESKYFSPLRHVKACFEA